MNKVDRNVPAELDLHVLDNSRPTRPPKVHKLLLRHGRFHFYFTPTYRSWMNLVERWFSALTTKKLQRLADTSIKDLAAEINAWFDQWNTDPKPFTWHRSADEILTKLAKDCTALTGNEFEDAST